MIFKRTYIYTTIAVVLGYMSMPLLSSCASDDDMPGQVESPDDPADRNNPDYAWLSIEINNAWAPQQNGSLDSRAGLLPTHYDETGKIEENYIDCGNGDFALLLFDDKMRYMKMIEKPDFEITTDKAVADSSLYRLRFRVPFDYLKYNYGISSDFALLFVANMKGVTTNYEPFQGIPFLTSFEEISRRLTWFEYTTGGTRPWEPDMKPAVKKKLIPMSGIKKFSVHTENLAASTYASPCDIGQIDVQRAMVKLRFLDDIDPAKTAYKVKMVSITGLNMCGAFIPSCDMAPQWAEATCHVEYATARPEWYEPNRYTYKIDEDFTDPDTGKKYKALSMYVAEYSDAIRPREMTGSRVKIIIGNDENVQIKDREYEILLSDLGITNLARNHIYQFSIKYDPVIPEKLTVDYKVCDWVVAPDINIDFN